MTINRFCDVPALSDSSMSSPNLPAIRAAALHLIITGRCMSCDGHSTRILELQVLFGHTLKWKRESNRNVRGASGFQFARLLMEHDD